MADSANAKNLDSIEGEDIRSSLFRGAIKKDFLDHFLYTQAKELHVASKNDL